MDYASKVLRRKPNVPRGTLAPNNFSARRQCHLDLLQRGRIV